MPKLPCISVIIAFVFALAETYFWFVGDSHMMTLMCGGVFLCVGIYFGWGLRDKLKGGDRWKKLGVRSERKQVRRNK